MRVFPTDVVSRQSSAGVRSLPTDKTMKHASYNDKLDLSTGGPNDRVEFTGVERKNKDNTSLPPLENISQ